jgi:hypothetical protein
MMQKTWADYQRQKAENGEQRDGYHDPVPRL